jgi:hypothetical protein
MNLNQASIPFFPKEPYLQYGGLYRPAQNGKTSLLLVWFHDTIVGDFVVQTRTIGATDWTMQTNLRPDCVRVSGKPIWWRFSAQLDLDSDVDFEYKVLLSGSSWFVGRATAPKSAESDLTVAILADILYQALPTDTVHALRVAKVVARHKPDTAFYLGDLAYEDGRVSEFPLFMEGFAPLQQRCATAANPGNHDRGLRTINTNLDWASFDDYGGIDLYFLHPENGPPVETGMDTSRLFPYAYNLQKYLATTGRKVLPPGNFFIDNGPIRFVFLEANVTMDWRNTQLQAWLESVLGSAGERWLVVNFHQPGFSSDATHGVEQRMRWIAPLLEKYNVTFAFHGHAHINERARPLRFTPRLWPDGKAIDALGRVDGTFQIDYQFDGVTNTRPEGPIHWTTGSGGRLVDLGHRPDRNNLPPYVVELIDDVCCFLILKATSKRLTVSLIDEYDHVLRTISVDR